MKKKLHLSKWWIFLTIDLILWCFCYGCRKEKPPFPLNYVNYWDYSIKSNNVFTPWNIQQWLQFEIIYRITVISLFGIMRVVILPFFCIIIASFRFYWMCMGCVSLSFALSYMLKQLLFYYINLALNNMRNSMHNANT